MAERQPSKLGTGVRFPLLTPWAPGQGDQTLLLFPMAARNRREVPGRNAAMFRPGAKSTAKTKKEEGDAMIIRPQPKQEEFL